MSRGLIILDPGHGKTGNPHTTKAGYYEGTQNFVLSQYLRDELLARGFDVKVTRETVDDDPELAERGGMAGRLGAIMFLSLHSNAPGASRSKEEYEKVRGAETFYSVSDEEGNAPLARALNDAVVSTMGTLDRGIKTRRYPDNESVDYYSVIRNAAQSGCCRAFLIEHGFHTNPEDSAFLQSSECLARLAKAEADVIDKYFE